MTTPELTLNNVKKTVVQTRTVRVSDFLSDDDKRNINQKRAQKAQKSRKFDEIDAYSAEILARFGYNAWQAWQTGQIKPEKMMRMIYAERARAKRELLGIEALIVAANAGANNPTKGGHAPKSLKNAIKILKNEQKQARG